MAKVEQETYEADILLPTVNAFVELLSLNGASSSDIYYNFLMKLYDEST